jgi:hypothetical protein
MSIMSRRPESLSPSSPTNLHSSNPGSTTSHRSPSPDDDDISTPPPSLPPTATKKPTFPAREDCWSEEATRTLIDAWGNRYIQLNRGNLRQKHWQDVAAAVNARHGHIKKSRRTDIQCKNRIDTLKKKYKIEKSKSVQSKSNYTSDWPFFSTLDSLIGSSFKFISPPVTSSAPAPLRKLRPPRKEAPPPPPPLFQYPSYVPVAPRSKRPAPAKIDDSFFRRNFSRIVAAAAAVEAGEESDASRSRSETDGSVAAAACRELAEAIGKLGRVYEKVEESKQKQLIELEKQRMEFAKDLEIQRMKLFMESQVQLHRIKRAKPSSDSEPDGYL